MDKARHKRNYDLHSWSGVTLGMFLFIVCFTGSVAVFATQETRIWEDPAGRITYTGDAADLSGAFDAWVRTQQSLGDVEYLEVSWPRADQPYFQAQADVHLDANDEHQWMVQRWHPSTLEPLQRREASMSQWLVDFHIYLKWPSFLGGYTLGSFLVGIAGVLLLLSILTGIVAHRKLTKEAFSLRFDRSVRLKWQDSHKVIGLWGSPFHIMIGFTGVVMGIVTFLAPVFALLAFQGNTEALFAIAQEPQVEASGERAEMISLEQIKDMRHPQSGEAPKMVTIANYGDAAAVYTGQWPASGKITYAENFEVSGVTGEPMAPNSVEEPIALPTRINNMLYPLHVGMIGGIAIKFVWFFLGIALSIITAFGTMMWVERRKHGNEGQRSDAFYDRLSKLNTGVCAGLALATASLFLHNTLHVGGEALRATAIGWIYLGAWALSIGYAFWRDEPYRATRELIGASGAVLVTAAILDQLVVEVPRAGFGAHSLTLWTDVTLLICGVGLLAIALKLPSKRIDKAARQNAMKGGTLEEQLVVPAE
ncbi:MAG: PepSY-associated TM helix domain-containing protein [Pseudomonadota bacterium]